MWRGLCGLLGARWVGCAVWQLGLGPRGRGRLAGPLLLFPTPHPSYKSKVMRMSGHRQPGPTPAPYIVSLVGIVTPCVPRGHAAAFVATGTSLLKPELLVTVVLRPTPSPSETVPCILMSSLDQFSSSW